MRCEHHEILMEDTKITSHEPEAKSRGVYTSSFSVHCSVDCTAVYLHRSHMSDSRCISISCLCLTCLSWKFFLSPKNNSRAAPAYQKPGKNSPRSEQSQNGFTAVILLKHFQRKQWWWQAKFCFQLYELNSIHCSTARKTTKQNNPAAKQVRRAGTWLLTRKTFWNVSS